MREGKKERGRRERNGHQEGEGEGCVEGKKDGAWIMRNIQRKKFILAAI